MLTRNHTRDVCDLKYDVAYHVIQIIERQLKLNDESSKTP